MSRPLDSASTAILAKSNLDIVIDVDTLSAIDGDVSTTNTTIMVEDVRSHRPATAIRYKMANAPHEDVRSDHKDTQQGFLTV